MEELFKELLDKIEDAGVELSDKEREDMLAKFKEKMDELSTKKDKVPEETTEVPEVSGEEVEAIEERVKKECALESAKMLQEVDDEATEEIEKMVDEIDKSVCDEIVELIDAMDAAACEEIEKIKAAYEAKIAELDNEASDAIEKVASAAEEKAITEGLVDKLSTFLDMEIERSIPSIEVVDKVKLSRLEKMCESMKEMLFVNDDYVQKEIVEAVEDATKIIAEKDRKINTVLNESIEYRKRLEKRESEIILESHTKKLPPKMQSFVECYCKGVPFGKLEEKIEEAIEAFNTDEMVTRKKINSRVSSKFQPITEEVQPKKKSEETNDVMSSYVKMLKDSIQ